MSSAKRTPQSAARKAPRPASPPTEVVDPAWLIRALALTLGFALLCAYLTACLLFYQGEWQLVLHPSHTVDRTPASVNLPFTPARFGDFNTGQPHLTGWWIPAQPAATQPAPHNSALTVLYLHGGWGSLSDTLPALTLLHNTGLNVFAIDYRGFGASDNSLHPDAGRMAQDAGAALDYLVSTRHIPAASIVPMGSGLGAALAVQLARDHPELRAIILDNPDPDPAATAAAASPSKIIPIRLLFGSRFAIAGPLATLSTPKLLIAGGPLAASNHSPASLQNLNALFRHAAGPSSIVMLPPSGPDRELQANIRQFLDERIPTP
jgi:hypothetical protein